MKVWNVISSFVSTLFVASILTFAMSPSISSAHDNPKNPCTGHHKADDGCGDGGSEDDATYSIASVDGDMSVDTVAGHSWTKHSRGVHPGGQQNALNTMIDLSYFDFLQGAACNFSMVTNITGGLVEKVKKNEAEAWFWFGGWTNDGRSGKYLVQTFGKITTSPSGWLPTHTGQPATLTMDSWAMRFENGQPLELEESACLGDSDQSSSPPFEYSIKIYLDP